jgi:hypothetical protein
MAASDSTFPPPALKAIAEEVGALLISRKESIAVAETVSLPSSCTSSNKILKQC